MLTLQFTGTLHHQAVVGKTAGCSRPEDGSVYVDLSRVTFVTPCGMATAAAWIVYMLREWKCTTCQVIRPDNEMVFTYLQNMNFFSSFKIFDDENFNRHEQLGRFVRMMRVDWNLDSSHAARVLMACLQAEDAIRSDLNTSLEEAISNVIGHAQCPGFVVAQTYERNTPNCRYEIAICDSGRGICAGLMENPKYQNLNHQDAVAKACERLVSGALHRHGRPDQRHFGIGLFTIDRIAETLGGVFRLYSGDAVRERIGSNVTVKSTQYWQGTIITVSLKHRPNAEGAKMPVNFEKRLRLG